MDLFSDKMANIYGYIILAIFAYEIYKIIKKEREAKKKCDELIFENRVKLEVEERVKEELKRREKED